MKNYIFVFIDESGDLGRFGSTYFVIACLLTENPIQLERIIKRVRQRILHKHEKELPEFKANASSEQVRKKILSMVNKTDSKIALLVFEKKNRDLRAKSKELYNQLVGSLLMEIDFTSTEQIEIIIDKKDNNQLLRNDLDDYVKKALEQFNNKITIKHLDSHYSKPLQVVDFIAWAAHRKYSLKDDSYYELIKEKVHLLKKE